MLIVGGESGGGSLRVCGGDGFDAGLRLSNGCT